MCMWACRASKLLHDAPVCSHANTNGGGGVDSSSSSSSSSNNNNINNKQPLRSARAAPLLSIRSSNGNCNGMFVCLSNRMYVEPYVCLLAHVVGPTVCLFVSTC
jgi:hypothetical protein